MEHPEQLSSVPAAIEAYRHRLDHLSAEGQQLRAALASSPDGTANVQALGVWQRECAATVSQLSGGSKAHWLSRAFSEALLVPAATAGSAGDTSVVTITDRLLSVLDSASRSLAGAVAPASSDSAGIPPPRPRFTFIKNAALCSGLERAYLDAQEAFSRGKFTLSLMTSCSVLETIITDALERRGLGQLASHEPPAGPIVSWPFATRIVIAERAGLISRGCARLPPVAREYRVLSETGGDRSTDSISARDAKLASDVLHVVLRDLAPGR